MDFSPRLARLYASALRNGMAKTASSGGNTATAIFDMPDIELFGGAGQSRDYQIRLQAQELQGLKRGDSVTIDSVAYTVREVRLIGDGAEKVATLSKN